MVSAEAVVFKGYYGWRSIELHVANITYLFLLRRFSRRVATIRQNSQEIGNPFWRPRHTTTQQNALFLVQISFVGTADGV